MRSTGVSPAAYCVAASGRVKTLHVDSLEMVQFGAGSALAAQCPRVPLPDGWRAWVEADGPVPDALATRAQAIAADQAVPLGATESFPLPGVTTLIRVEPHAWGRDAQGALVAGCFRAGAIFLPSGTADGAGITPPQESGSGKLVAGLTVASLAVGIIATLASFGGDK
jgi:hypothetical protein